MDKRRKQGARASEQGRSKKDKEDESKPTDSSKLQQVSKQETGKKTPGARARRKESSKAKVGRLAAGLGLVGWHRAARARRRETKARRQEKDRILAHPTYVFCL